MGSLTASLDTLTTAHWIAIVGILVAVLLWYLTPFRDRWLKDVGPATPEVKATINKDIYEGGWRSVQLHLTEPPDAKNFKLKDWRIVRAALLRPAWPVVLARAQNDDYAQRVFYPNDPVRALNGKAEGRPQRFALEFFIHFKRDDDRGQRAKFQVVFAHLNKRRTHTIKVWTAVPQDAKPLGEKLVEKFP